MCMPFCRTHLDLFLQSGNWESFHNCLCRLAFTCVSLPNIILTQALVAGLVLVLMRQTPGIAKTPVFFTEHHPYASFGSRLGPGLDAADTWDSKNTRLLH